MILAENGLFQVRGNQEYARYAQELVDKVAAKSKDIRKFYKIPVHEKIVIDLFMTKEELHNYIYRKYGEVSPSYSDGGFQNSNIFIEAKMDELEHHMHTLVNVIIHEYSHLLYKKIYDGNFSRVLWVDEGLAQHLSGQKSLFDKNEARFKSFFLRRVVAKNKDIPKLDDLRKHGTKRGEFGYPRYDGYAISYMLVRYLFAKVERYYKKMLSEDAYNEKMQSGALKEMINNDVYSIIIDPDKIAELEQKGVLGKMINYYGSKFRVRPSAININRITRPEELMDYMDVCITYGWIDKFGNKHRDELKDFKALYKTNSIEQILASNLGTCIEQAKFQKYVFNKLGLECKIFVDRRYEKYDEKKGIKMHVLTVYEDNNKWYYFEHSNTRMSGIRAFDSLDDFIEYYKSTMSNDRILTEIPEIPDGLSYGEFNQYVNRIDEKEVNMKRTF